MSEHRPHNIEQLPWEAIRERDFNPSFRLVEDWIRKNNNHIQRSLLRRRRMRRLSLLTVVVVMVACSLTIKTESVVRYGDLFYFNVNKGNTALINRLSALNFGWLVITSQKQPSQLSYVAIVLNEKLSLQFEKELKSLTGISNFDITPVQYKVKNSLFQKIFKKEPPDAIKIENTVQKELKRKGITATVKINTEKHDAVLTAIEPAKVAPDTLTPIAPTVKDIVVRKPARLQNFNWLVGAWKVKNVPNDTWHYWTRINDSLLKCVIIEVAKDEKINKTDGFSITHSFSGDITLYLKSSQWKLISSNAKEFIFKNEAEANPNVKWMMKDGIKAWQSMIFSEYNAEFINLEKEDPARFNKLINDLEIQL